MKCPRCSSPVSGKRCPNCGKKLDNIDQPTLNAEGPKNPDINVSEVNALNVNSGDLNIQDPNIVVPDLGAVLGGNLTFGQTGSSSAPLVLKWHKESYPQGSPCFMKFYLQSRLVSPLKITLLAGSNDAHLMETVCIVGLTSLQEQVAAIKCRFDRSGEYILDTLYLQVEDHATGNPIGVYRAAKQIFFKVTRGDVIQGAAVVVDPFGMQQMGGHQLDREEIQLVQDSELTEIICASGKRPNPVRTKSASNPALERKICLTVCDEKSSETWYLFAKEEVRFGRAGMSSGYNNDVILRLLPETRENQELSKLIGRKQFLCTGRKIQCLGDAVMTVDGRHLNKGDSVHVGEYGKIVISRALTLQYKVISRGKPEILQHVAAKFLVPPDAILFKRESNCPHIGYAQVNRCLPISTLGKPCDYSADLAGELCFDKRWLFFPKKPVGVKTGDVNPGDAIEIEENLKLTIGTTRLIFERLSETVMKGRSHIDEAETKNPPDDNDS